MANDWNLDRIKSIDQNQKDTIYGYIKSFESQYNYVIPPLISSWILLYYMVDEMFDADNTHSSYTLSEDNTLVTKTTNGEAGIAYLNNSFRCGVHHWRFKLTNVHPSNYSITIGVCAGEPLLAVDNYSGLRAENAKHRSYGWVVTWRKLTLGDNTEAQRFGTQRVGTGDILDCILDLDRGELGYILNSGKYQVAFEKLRATVYRCGLDMYRKDDSVKLLFYEPTTRSKVKQMTNQ